MKTYSVKGFSLVELLVSMSILMMVLLIGTLSYNQYSQYWNKELGDFDQQIKEAKDFSFIYHILRNIRPHMIKDNTDKWFHYFEGGNTLLRSVTAESISSPGSAAIFELKIETESDSTKITYQEKPIVSAPFLSRGQVGGYTFRRTIELKISNFLFEYYGWKHSDEFFSSQENRDISQSWFGLYSGEDTLLTPSKIRVSFANDLGQTSLLVPVDHFIPEHIQFYSNGGE